MSATAEHLRDAILAALAKSETSMSSAEIYECIDIAESRQAVAAQINHLKKAGKIDSWQTDAGVMRHMLAVPASAMPASDPAPGASSAIETSDHQTEVDQPSPSPLDLPDVDLHRIVWSQPHGNATRFLTLTIADDQPRLNTSGAFAVDPALLRQMADLIDVLQQRVAA
ncbi:MAG: hypothetical protein MZV65_39635 [Chromatiales bacterium]|nr:hypothetical protein [Chromatiales bacterium]MCK7581149.1 hypothetical protein [Chromatiales bacterium]